MPQKIIDNNRDLLRMDGAKAPRAGTKPGEKAEAKADAKSAPKP
jgi:hypothetical protein